MSQQRIKPVHVSKETDKVSKNKKKHNLQKVTFNTAVANLGVLCANEKW